MTVGDVAGVGPELVAMVLEGRDVYSTCRPVVIGVRRVLSDRAAALGLSLSFRVADGLADARFEEGCIDVIEPGDVRAMELPGPGQVDAVAGRIAGRLLETAFGLAAEGGVDGVVGAPLNKEAFRLGGYNYVDEIAFLTEMTGSSEPRLFGILDYAWTTCATLHVAFRDVARFVTRQSVLASITSMDAALRNSGLEEPRIAVAALNPHNGEGGLLGREEIDEIGPAVQEASCLGIRASGPFPADTIFPRVIAEGMRGVVCMYHDQANIARKLRGFKDSASGFVGFPVPYATTAHGTAFDLVGTGKVDPSSLIAALGFVVRQCQGQH
jgi:4-hydroxythreonine-4-phosphate dehydrogenase